MAVPVVQVVDPTELANSPAPRNWPSPSREEIVAHAPDASLAIRGDNALLARCSLWWRDVPPYGDERLGVIGHYGAESIEAGHAILRAAMQRLAENGCTFAVGPMDGNTWRSYRLVVERGTEPPFMLEPRNPDDWPLHYEAAGFTPLAHYFSAINTDLSRRDERVGAAAERFAKDGVVLRTVDPTQFERDLHGIYSVAEVAFRDAFLYTPLPENAFAEQYLRIRKFVRPELVILAEQNDRAVGFVFSIPDLLEAGVEGGPRTVILKTLAILPGASFRGLGSLLADRCQEAAHTLGYKRVIHALMHESNRSRNISAATGAPMRRYALFGQRL